MLLEASLFFPLLLRKIRVYDQIELFLRSRYNGIACQILHLYFSPYGIQPMLTTSKVILIKGPNSACYTFNRMNVFFLYYASFRKI